MALRCPTCQKLARVNSDVEPEIDDELFDCKTGQFTANVRLVNECAECGIELAEYNFTVLVNFKEDLDSHECPDADTGIGWTAEIVHHTRGIRMHPPGKKIQIKFQTIEVGVTLTCNCKDKVTSERSWADEVKTSNMEALV